MSGSRTFVTSSGIRLMPVKTVEVRLILLFSCFGVNFNIMFSLL